MKRTLVIIVIAFLLELLTGCQTYRNSPLTPDGFNYTLERDRNTGNIADYFGFTWKLK